MTRKHKAKQGVMPNTSKEKLNQQQKKTHGSNNKEC
jgi:hypothetical protein